MKNRFVHQKDSVYFYNLSGKLVEEKIEGKFLLLFLYATWWGFLARFFFRTRLVNRLIGWYLKSKWSCKLILPFIKKHQINMQDFEREFSNYDSFNDFFIRKLRGGARYIEENKNVFVSPVDGKLAVIPEVSLEENFFLKGACFNLNKLCKSDSLAASFVGGDLFVFRLAPYDYHRFHLPFDAKVLGIIPVLGYYDSVNPIALRYGATSLETNARKIIKLRSEIFGDVLFVAIGAMMVGSIQLRVQNGDFCFKGEELGFFEFGGSTICLLFKNGVVRCDNSFLKHSTDGFESEVRMGMAVGVKKERS